MLERIPTGIDGVDELLGGGILAGDTVLVEGVPGCGKTTFGLQFIYEGVTRFHQNGLVVTFEQFPEQMYRDALNYGWDMRTLEKANRLRILCTSPEVFAKLLHEPQSLLDDMTAQVAAKRVFLDSISHLENLARDGSELRSIINGVLNSLKSRGFTTFLAKEVRAGKEDALSFESYIVDALIRIENHPDELHLRRRRTIEILKTRGQGHVSGAHPFRFGPKGIEVFPTRLAERSEETITSKRKRTPTGITGLDHLLGGGIPSGSTYLLAGGAGTGKTICGLQFLQTGATVFREKGVLFSYEQPPSEAYEMAAGFGWNLQRLGKSGKVIVSHNYFGDIDLDEHLWYLRDVIQKTGAKRLVFDSLTAMLHGVSAHPYLVTEKVSQVSRLTKSLQCTTLLISAIPSGSDRISTYGIEESLADGVILLRVSPDDIRRKRSIEVCKARGIDHGMGPRRMAITPRGIQVYYRSRDPEVSDDS